MKTKHFAAMAVLVAAAMTGCAGQKEAKSTSGIDLANLDTTVSASQDFYHYACGGWMKNHPLTAEYSRYGTFEVLIEKQPQAIAGTYRRAGFKTESAGYAGSEDWRLV